MKKTTGFFRLFTVVLSFALIAAVALSLSACGKTNTNTPLSTEEAISNDISVSTETPSDASKKATELGEGKTSFNLTVTDADGKETSFVIKTDEKTVGAALVALKLISGEDGQYGLYIKEVNGITADYDKDGTYWAFYVNGEYATAGIDLTDITEGASYALKVEKG